MTSNNHTPIANGATNDKATWNNPMSQLDTAIGNVAALTTSNKASVVAAANELRTLMLTAIAAANADGEVATARDGETALLDTVTIIKGGRINPKAADYGFVADGSTDNSSAWTGLLSALSDGDTVFFPRGTYVFNKLAITKAVRIVGDGAVFKSNSGTANTPVLQFTGTADGTTYPLTADVARGAYTFQVTGSVPYAAGDYIVLRDDAHATDNAEVHRIESVTAGGTSTLTLDEPVWLPKATADGAEVYKMTPLQNIWIEGVRFQGKSGETAGNGGLWFKYCRNVVVRDIQMTASIQACVRFEYCYDVTVENFDLSAPQLTGAGQAYGLAFYYGTCHIKARNGTGYGMRHVIDNAGAHGGVFENIWDVGPEPDGASPGNASFQMSHNGWDSDHTFINCHAFRAYRGFYFNPQDWSDLVSGISYGARAYGFKVLGCTHLGSTDASGATSGVTFFAPAVDCVVRDFVGVANDGTAAPTSGASGIRFLPVDNVNCMIDNCRLVGYYSGVIQTHSATQPAIENYENGLRIRNLSVKNANYGYRGTFVSSVDIVGAHFDDIDDAAVSIGDPGTGQDLYRLAVRDARVINSPTLTNGIISLPDNAIPAPGVAGKLDNITRDTATDNGITVAATDVLTRTQILTDGGRHLRLKTGGTGSVTLGTDALPVPIVEGHLLTIINSESSDSIVIPDGANNVNINGASVTLARASKIGATWISIAQQWWQIS